MENTKDNIYEENYDEKHNIFEKKIIIYLVIITLLLIFFSIFFIKDIVDFGVVNSKQTAVITYPDKEDIDNIDYSNDGNNQNNNNNNQTPVIVDREARLRILQGTTEWNELKELDIFEHSAIHVATGKIAPGVEGTYTYTVENPGELDMLYNIAVSEDNPYKVNMVFKLKRNGNFVAGNDNEWVKVDQLTQENIKIATGSTDIYTLDWKWEDSENDTEIGKTEDAYYKIQLQADAEADM